eukprot:NODE_990_length_2498_cov_0.366820.p1 type:complete len:576 gc:universal NODE_990_length_2498_cov_0.366820:2351-624(-)
MDFSKVPLLSVNPIFKLCHPDVECSDADLEQSSSIILDISEPLVLAITGDYQQDPSMFQNDIHAINSLLNSLFKYTHSIHQYCHKNKTSIMNNSSLPELNHKPFLQYLFSALEHYSLYFHIIIKYNIDKLFPNAIQFIWIDTTNNKSYEQLSWAFEKANLLFNLAQLHYLIASIQLNPITPNYDHYLKQSPHHHFINAANIMNFMKSNFLHPPTDDLQSWSLDAFINYYLGLAQLQMLLNAKKSTLISKLCKGAHTLFSKSLKIVSASDLSLLEAFSNVYQAQVELESNHHGQRIGRLQYALSILPDNYKELKISLKSLIKTAIHENEVVYHENTVKSDELLDIPDIIAIKLPDPSINLVLASNININSFLRQFELQSLFNGILPLKVVETASIYSERVSDLIRKLDNNQFDEWLSSNHIIMRIKRWNRISSVKDVIDANQISALTKRVEELELESPLVNLIQSFITAKNNHSYIPVAISNHDKGLMATYEALQSNSIYSNFLAKTKIETFIQQTVAPNKESSLVVVDDSVQFRVSEIKDLLESWYSLQQQRQLVVDDIKKLVLFINQGKRGCYQ